MNKPKLSITEIRTRLIKFANENPDAKPKIDKLLAIDDSFLEKILDTILT